MRLALLHAGGGYRPDRFLKIELTPLGLPHFTRPLKDVRCELKCQLRDWLARIAGNCSQQCAKCDRIGDRGVVLVASTCGDNGTL